MIYGAGGMGRVALDGALAAGYQCRGVFDDDESTKPLVSPVQFLGPYRAETFPAIPLVIAIGDARVRKRLSLSIRHQFLSVAAPSAQISLAVHIGQGVILGPLSVLNAGAVLGAHVIINTGAIVEHDCVVESFVHIGPRAVLCGDARVGEGTEIGAGAVVLPGVQIGRGCVIGAGAVVTRDVPDDSVAYGVPARVMRPTAEKWA